ncbi:hypothetical protein BDW62DRAFT_178757 [Aspergillus aurantiobrunneus]
MPKTRQLLRSDITYSIAKNEEINILHQLKYPKRQIQFFTFLRPTRTGFDTLSNHLNLPPN